eukprot:gene7276-5120_t
MTEPLTAAFEDASDVTHSTAFVILDTLVEEGHIVEERAEYLKQKFKDIHTRVLTIYKRDNLLLKRARQLRAQLDTERHRVQARGEIAKRDDDEIQMLKRQVVELEKDLTAALERESVLQVEALEMDRRKQNLLLEREDALAAEEARIRPKIERTQQEIYDMGERVKEMISTCEELQKKQVLYAKEEEELKNEIGGFTSLFSQCKQQYANLERDPERAMKQLQLVKRSLAAATREAGILDEKLKVQQDSVAHLELVRSTRAQDLAAARAKKQKIMAEIESKRKTLGTITASLEAEQETRQSHIDRLSELEQLITTTKIAKNQEEDNVERMRREKDKCMRDYSMIQQNTSDVTRERQSFKELQSQCKRSMEEQHRRRKELLKQIESGRADVSAKQKRLLKEQRKEKTFTNNANVLLEDISNVEDMMAIKREQEEAKRRELLTLTLKRQDLSRECAREANRAIVTKNELHTKEVHHREVHRRQEELQKQLDSLTTEFQRVKRERSQMAAQIQAIAQKMTEVAEKTKILENELEVLLRECALKEKDLLKKKRQTHEITQTCTNLRLEKNKQRKRLVKVTETEKEIKAQVRRMNTELTIVEEDMTAIQHEYENAIDSRNQTGVLLIDKNDETSLLVEKAKTQEAAIELGTALTNQRSEEIRQMKRRVADLARAIEVCSKALPKVRQLEEDLRSLQMDLEDEAWRVEVLENDLTNPNNPHRWRRIEKVLPAQGVLPPGPPPGLTPEPQSKIQLRPDDPNQDPAERAAAESAAAAEVAAMKNCPSSEYVQLHARCQDLEARVNAINEKLREKDLILAEVTELAERIGTHAHNGKEFTLALAKQVNEHQSGIRSKTRGMMATISELSLFQASSIQLQREVQYLESLIEEAEQRLEAGEAPFAEAEDEYYRMKRNNQRYQEALERRAAERQAQENPDSVVRTTAPPRPNSYVPNDELGLPKPFGTFTPFRPGPVKQPPLHPCPSDRPCASGGRRAPASPRRAGGVPVASPQHLQLNGAAGTVQASTAMAGMGGSGVVASLGRVGREEGPVEIGEGVCLIVRAPYIEVGQSNPARCCCSAALVSVKARRRERERQKEIVRTTKENRTSPDLIGLFFFLAQQRDIEIDRNTLAEMTSSPRSGYRVELAAHPHAGGGVTALGGVLATAGDEVHVVRDAARRVRIGLRADAAGTPRPMLLSWEGDFLVAVNGVLYGGGPVPLSDGDALQLCAPKTCGDSHTYRLRAFIAPSPCTALRSPALPAPAPVNENVEPEFVEECTKWSNFYGWRYSTTNYAAPPEPRMPWRRYLALRPQEGCPSILVATQVMPEDLLPRPVAALSPAEMLHTVSRGEGPCGLGFKCHVHCPLCRHPDAHTLEQARTNTTAFLKDLRQRAASATPSPAPPTASADAADEQSPWIAFEAVRRSRAGLRAAGAASAARVPPPAPAAATASGPPVTAAVVCERIERLERLLAGTTQTEMPGGTTIAQRVDDECPLLKKIETHRFAHRIMVRCPLLLLLAFLFTFSFFNRSYRIYLLINGTGMGRTGLQAGAAFCFLNALCAVFVSICFQRRITSMSVPSTLNGWDPDTKAQACWRAGILYVLTGLGLTLAARWSREAEAEAEASSSGSFQRHDHFDDGSSPSQPLLTNSQRIAGYDAQQEPAPNRGPTGAWAIAAVPGEVSFVSRTPTAAPCAEQLLFPPVRHLTIASPFYNRYRQQQAIAAASSTTAQPAMQAIGASAGPPPPLPLPLPPPPAYPPEDDEGSTEYKWRLLPESVPAERVVHLVTQMRFRLSEGQGRCHYVVGVSDSGATRGLPASEYEATVAMVQRLAAEAEAVAVETRRYQIPSHEDPALYCGELQVMRNPGSSPSAGAGSEDAEHTQIAFCGPVGCGKTTLVAVLLAGGGGPLWPPAADPLLPTRGPVPNHLLDDGRGSARHRLFSHRHEIETGRTASAIARAWRPPGLSGPPLVLVDAGDGLTRAVLFTLLHRAPQLLCLCLSATDLAAEAGGAPAAEGSAIFGSDAPPLSAFLDLIHELKVPLLLVITKRDLVEDELEWDTLVMDGIAAVERANNGRWPAVELVEGIDSSAAPPFASTVSDIVKQVMSNAAIGVVPLSAVTGEGLQGFIRLLASEVALWAPQRSPLYPPTPLFLPAAGPGAPPSTHASPPPALGGGSGTPTATVPPAYFEFMVDDLDAHGLEPGGGVAAVVGLLGRVVSGCIAVGQRCVLGPLAEGRFPEVGTVKELIVGDTHELCIRACELGPGQQAWVVVQLTPVPPATPAVGGEVTDAAQSTDREELLAFLKRFKRNRRHPKGRVLLSEPPDPQRLAHFAATTWQCDLDVRNLSSQALAPTCEPLLIARHAVQAVSLASARDQGSEPEAALLGAGAGCRGSLRCTFLFTPDVLWVGEVVLLQWPPGGLAVAQVSALYPSELSESQKERLHCLFFALPLLFPFLSFSFRFSSAGQPRSVALPVHSVPPLVEVSSSFAEGYLTAPHPFASHSYRKLEIYIQPLAVASYLPIRAYLLRPPLLPCSVYRRRQMPSRRSGGPQRGTAVVVLWAVALVALLCGPVPTVAARQAKLRVVRQSAPDGVTRSITFLSSGYAAWEEAKFHSDVNTCVAALSNYSTGIIADPWPRYADQMNLYAVFEASSLPGFGVDNNLGCMRPGTAYNEMWCSVSQVTSLATYAPSQDVLLVLVNDGAADGIGGNGLAVITNNAEYMALLAVHYLNRAIANLAEEFSEGVHGDARDPVPNCVPSRPDALSEWHHWIEELTKEGVSLAGSGCTFSNYYSLTQHNCLMRTSEYNAMCPVCREQLNKAFFFNGVADGYARKPSTAGIYLGAGQCPPANEIVVTTATTVLYAGNFAEKNDVSVTWMNANNEELGTGKYYEAPAVSAATTIRAVIKDASPYLLPGDTQTSDVVFHLVPSAPAGVTTAVPKCYGALEGAPAAGTSPTYCPDGSACPSGTPAPEEADEALDGAKFVLPPLRDRDFTIPVAIGGGISLAIWLLITIAYFVHYRRAPREVLDVTTADRFIIVVLCVLITLVWIFAVFTLGASHAREKREIVVHLPVCAVTVILCSVTLGLAAVNYIAALLRKYLLCAVCAACGAGVGISLFIFGVFAILSTAGSASAQFQSMLYNRWKLAVSENERFLCPFQRQYECSGYFTSCFEIASTACITSCNANHYMKSCGEDFTHVFKRQYKPIDALILVVSCLHILVGAMDAIYYMRYRQIASTGRFCRSFRHNPHPPVLPITFNEARRARKSFAYASRHTNGKMSGKAAVRFVECIFDIPVEEEERKRIMSLDTMNFDELMLVYFPYAQTTRMDPRMLTPDEAEATSDMLQLERKQYRRLQEFEECSGCLSPERLHFIFQTGFGKVFMPLKEEILAAIRNEAAKCPEAPMCRGLSPAQIEGLRGLWVSVHPSISGELSDGELEILYNYTHDDTCNSSEKLKQFKKKLDVRGTGQIRWGEFCYPYAQKALLRDAREYLKAVESDLPPELLPKSFVMEKYGESMRSVFLPYEEEIPVERVVVALMRRWSDNPLHERQLFETDIYHTQELHNVEEVTLDKKNKRRTGICTEQPSKLNHPTTENIAAARVTHAWSSLHRILFMQWRMSAVAPQRGNSSTSCASSPSLAPAPIDLTDADLQVLLLNTQGVVLALRSNSKVSFSNTRFTPPAASALHELLANLLVLQRELLYRSTRSQCVAGSDRPRFDAFSYRNSARGRAFDFAQSATEWMQSPNTAVEPELAALSEASILAPFCAICLSPDAGATTVAVALSCLSAVVEAPCSFISARGLSTVVNAALMSLTSTDADGDMQELYLGRVAATCVACLQHPAATALPEELYVEVAQAVVSISVDPLFSPQLKKATESSLKVVVSLLFQRLLARWMAEATSDAGSTSYEVQVYGSPRGVHRVRHASSDGSYMMCFISSLIWGEDPRPEGWRGDDTRSEEERYDVRAAVQLEGLWLAQQAILVVDGHLSEPRLAPLLAAVKDNLCRALLVAGVRTKHVVVLSLITRTIHMVIHAAGDHLVPQIYSFLRVLHLSPLGSAEEVQAAGSPASPGTMSSASARSLAEAQERREVLLESLAYLCSQGSFCRFCYTNYDLSSRYAAVLPLLCDVLVYQACGRLEAWRDSSGRTSVTDDHLLAMQAAGNLLLTLTEVYPPSPAGLCAATPKEVDAAVQRTIRQKNLLVQFSSLFAESAQKKGVPFLLESATRVRRGEEREVAVRQDSWLVLADPAGGREVGEALFRLSSLLDKRALGEYLGEPGDFHTQRPEEGVMVGLPDGTEVPAIDLWESRREEESLKMGTASFYDAQLRGFIHQFNFKGKTLLAAIREMVYCVCLPGESQKIDRIMEVFSQYWYEVNPPNVDPQINPFSCDSAAFILSFAIIMLNTDQHSGKLHQPMSFLDFQRMNLQADEGSEIPEAYLREVYTDVKAHEIIMAEMMDKGFTNDVTWNLEMGSSVEKDTVAAAPASGPRRTSRSPRMCFWDVLNNAAPQRHDQGRAALGESSALRTTACLEPRSQQLLSRYVFASVWKRSLRLFSGVVGLMMQLSAVPAIGEDLAASVAHVGAVAPVELSALVAALRGLTAVIVVAKRLNVPEVVDAAYMCLLTHLEGKGGEAVAELAEVTRNLPQMLLLREMFDLLPHVAAGLSESWGPLSRTLVNLFEMGALALSPQEEQRLHAESSRHHQLPEALRSHPAVRLSDEGPKCPSSSAQESGGGSWLSSLWTAAVKGSRLRDTTEQRRSLSRIRGCVPHIHHFLDMTSSMPPAAHRQLVQAICACSTRNFKTPTDARTFSYVFSLLCAMTADNSLEHPSTLQALPPMVSGPLNTLHKIMDKKLPMDEANLLMAIEMSAPEYRAPLDSPVLWLRVLHRIVEGVLTVMGVALRAVPPDTDVLRALLDLLGGVPKRVYHRVVVEQLLQVVDAFLQEAAEQGGQGADALPRTRHLAFNPAVAVLLGCSSQLDRDVGARVLERYTAALFAIAQHELYDPQSQAENLMEAAVSIGLLREKVREQQQRADKKTTEGGSSAGGALTLCSRTLLRCRMTNPSMAPYWERVWLLSLKGIGALAVRAGPPLPAPETGRPSVGDAIGCLELCALQVAKESRDAALLAVLYREVLLPLAESCGTGEAGATPGTNGTAVLSAAEVVINRAFYNYWAEELRLPCATKQRVIRLLPRPLLEFLSAGPPTVTETVGGTPATAPLLDIWKQMLIVLLHIQQTSGAPEHRAAVHDAVRESVGELLAAAHPPAPNGPESAAAPVLQPISTHPEFWPVTAELVRLCDWSVPLLCRDGESLVDFFSLFLLFFFLLNSHGCELATIFFPLTDQTNVRSKKRR